MSAFGHVLIAHYKKNRFSDTIYIDSLVLEHPLSGIFLTYVRSNFY